LNAAAPVFTALELGHSYGQQAASHFATPRWVVSASTSPFDTLASAFFP